MTEKKMKKDEYIEAVGRRKNAVARVRLFKATKNSFIINEKPAEDYFNTEEMKYIINSAFDKTKVETKFKVTAKINGGGIHAQAEALRHGMSRAMVIFDEELRKKLKKAGFLKRDPREKERKKFGLKKARKSPQWSKR